MITVMKKNFSKKIIGLFIAFGVLFTSTSNSFAQTGPFTISTSVDKAQAIITVTYDISVKPIPSGIRVTVSDDAGCKECYGVSGTYWRGQDFAMSASASKALMALDELKSNTTYYVFVYNKDSRVYYNSTFKTSNNTSSPPITTGKGLTASYSSTAKDSLAVKVTNNSSFTYSTLLYISKTGSSSYLQSDINLGNIKPAQVVNKTITNLNPNTSYDIEIKGYKIVDGQNETTAEKVTISNAKTLVSGTGTGITPTGTGTGTTPSGTGTGTTPKKNNSVTSGLGLDNPTNITSIEDFVAKALNIVVDIGTPLVAFFLILSGFMFVAARGNEEKLATAKRSLVYTLIGAALVLGCWGIAQAVKGTIEDVTKTSFTERKEDVL